MYRTLLATCGSENFRGLYSLKLRIFGSHFRGATRCKQRAVHFFPAKSVIKIDLSIDLFGALLCCLFCAQRAIHSAPSRRQGACAALHGTLPLFCHFEAQFSAQILGKCAVSRKFSAQTFAYLGNKPYFCSVKQSLAALSQK